MSLTSTEAKTTAEVIARTLPYIQRFSGKTVVVKYGGNAMGDDKLKLSFARDIVLMKAVGIKTSQTATALCEAGAHILFDTPKELTIRSIQELM